MHVVFVEPAFPNNQREFLRGLLSTGARVSAISERPAEALPAELRENLFQHERVRSVVDEHAMTEAVKRLSKRARAPQNGDEPLHEFLAAIQRISALNAGESRLIDPELIALELRTACEALGCGWSREATELMLGRIFASFCIGK